MSHFLKTFAWELLLRSHFYPHPIFLNYSPFKIVELAELLKQTEIQSTDELLDIGCGSGTQTFLLAQKCRNVVGIDIDESELAIARWRYERLRHRFNCDFLCSTLQKASLASGRFDKAFSICVIEHMPDYPEVLCEVFRLLKPGGEFVLSADSLGGIEDPGLLERHRRDSFVERFFSVDELRDLLLHTGFQQVSVYPIFKGPYARRLFEWGIQNRFKFNRLYAQYAAGKIASEDSQLPDARQGMFLIAKCMK